MPYLDPKNCPIHLMLFRTQKEIRKKDLLSLLLNPQKTDRPPLKLKTELEAESYHFKLKLKTDTVPLWDGDENTCLSVDRTGNTTC